MSAPSPSAPQLTFAELYTAKLVTMLRESHGLRDLRAGFSNVPPVDVTVVNALRGFVQTLERSETRIYFAGARPAVQKALEATGFGGEAIHYAAHAAAAFQQLKTGP